MVNSSATVFGSTESATVSGVNLLHPSQQQPGNDKNPPLNHYLVDPMSLKWWNNYQIPILFSSVLELVKVAL